MTEPLYLVHGTRCLLEADRDRSNVQYDELVYETIEFLRRALPNANIDQLKIDCDLHRDTVYGTGRTMICHTVGTREWTIHVNAELRYQASSFLAALMSAVFHGARHFSIDGPTSILRGFLGDTPYRLGIAYFRDWVMEFSSAGNDRSAMQLRSLLARLPFADDVVRQLPIDSRAAVAKTDRAIEAFEDLDR